MDTADSYTLSRASSSSVGSADNNRSSYFSSDDTEFLDIPKSVAAHSKRRFKTSVELRIMEDNQKSVANGDDDGIKMQSNGGTNLNPISGDGAKQTQCKKRVFLKSGTKPAVSPRHQSPGVSSLASESVSSRWSSSDEETSAYNDRSMYSKESYCNDDDEEEDEEADGEKESRDGLDDIEGIFAFSNDTQV